MQTSDPLSPVPLAVQCVRSLMDRHGLPRYRQSAWLANAVGRIQDHFEATLHVLDEEAKLQVPEKRGIRAVNWNGLVKRAAQFAVNKSALQAKRNEVTKKRQKYATAHLTTAPRVGAGQDQVGDVRAAQQQDHADHSEK